jgi:hypothetical protein
MVYKCLFSALAFLALGSDLKALNDTDKFILNHCQSVCTGEKADCNDCYTTGVQLFNIF